MHFVNSQNYSPLLYPSKVSTFCVL